MVLGNADSRRGREFRRLFNIIHRNLDRLRRRATTAIGHLNGNFINVVGIAITRALEVGGSAEREHTGRAVNGEQTAIRATTDRIGQGIAIGVSCCGRISGCGRVFVEARSRATGKAGGIVGCRRGRCAATTAATSTAATGSSACEAQTTQDAKNGTSAAATRRGRACRHGSTNCDGFGIEVEHAFNDLSIGGGDRYDLPVIHHQANTAVIVDRIAVDVGIIVNRAETVRCTSLSRRLPPQQRNASCCQKCCGHGRSAAVLRCRIKFGHFLPL